MSEMTAPAASTNNRSIVWIWTSFEGRIGRGDYWLKYVVPLIGIYIVLMIVEMTIGLTYDAGMGSEAGILTSIFALLNVWFGFAVGAKRCHDRDRSGWFQAIILIPIIGGIWLLIELGFLKGSEGENRFGPDPLVAFQASASAPAE